MAGVRMGIYFGSTFCSFMVSITNAVLPLFELQVAVDTIVEVGDAKEVVCKTAEEIKVDLLILGSHSRGPIERYS
jgi:nucleotide-binding universal stress UspA family protein